MPPCVFRRKYTDSSYSFILAYVDDLLVLAETASEKNKIVKELQNMFEVRVADKVELFLRSPSGMRSWTLKIVQYHLS